MIKSCQIQCDLFAEIGDGSAVGYLRKILHERFDIDGLPEGYFYFSISNGGLELCNTMLEVLSLHIQNKPLSTYKFMADDKDIVMDNEGALESALDSDPNTESALSDSRSRRNGCLRRSLVQMNSNCIYIILLATFFVCISCCLPWSDATVSTVYRGVLTPRSKIKPSGLTCTRGYGACTGTVLQVTGAVSFT